MEFNKEQIQEVILNPRKWAEKKIGNNKEKTEKLSIFDKVRQQSQEATGLQGGVQPRADSGSNAESEEVGGENSGV